MPNALNGKYRREGQAIWANKHASVSLAYPKFCFEFGWLSCTDVPVTSRDSSDTDFNRSFAFFCRPGRHEALFSFATASSDGI